MYVKIKINLYSKNHFLLFCCWSEPEMWCRVSSDGWAVWEWEVSSTELIGPLEMQQRLWLAETELRDTAEGTTEVRRTRQTKDHPVLFGSAPTRPDPWPPRLGPGPVCCAAGCTRTDPAAAQDPDVGIIKQTERAVLTVGAVLVCASR